MKQEKVLIIGSGGQIGVELAMALRKVYGTDNVIASDLREAHPLLKDADLLTRSICYKLIFHSIYFVTKVNKIAIKLLNH